MRDEILRSELHHERQLKKASQKRLGMLAKEKSQLAGRAVDGPYQR